MPGKLNALPLSYALSPVLFLSLFFPFSIYTEEAEKYFFGLEIESGTVLPSN
jgi:hypothetical protein